MAKQLHRSNLRLGWMSIAALLVLFAVTGVASAEEFVEQTIEAIIAGARTGRIGDGKIFVSDLPECIRIRTGQRGGAAIG